jgi:hypothetical protein
VYEASDGVLVLYNGVTRATRIARLAPGTPIRVQVVGRLKRASAADPIYNGRRPDRPLRSEPAVMTFVWAALFVLAVLTFWFLNLLGLPGNWMIVVASAVYAWLLPGDSRATLGWSVVGVIAGLAALGEVMELAASAAGVKRAGGSRLGAFFALAGSLAGALTGLFVGIPIPVVGSVVGAVLFAGAGAMFGAMLGEQLGGRSADASWEIGKAAFWGRLLGTLAKTAAGAVIAAVAIAAVCV